MFKIIFGILISIQSLGVLANWKEHFYTDDSPYYHQVNQEGFTHLIRIDEQFCNEIQAIWVESINQSRIDFNKIDPPTTNYFGIHPNDFCWFKATINNMNLHSPQNNRYLLVFEEINGKKYFYGEIKDSILPAKRLKNNKQEVAWLTPGTQGANAVKGGGVLFKVWAPNAELVELFINRGQNKITMSRDSDGLNPLTNYSAFVETATEKTTYHFQFVVNGKYEEVEIDAQHNTTPIKLDPLSREISYSKKGALVNNYRDVYSMVSKKTDFQFEFDDTIKSYINISKNNNWIIYQLWPMAFNPKITSSGPQNGTFKSIIEKIDYLSSLGINAVELLPVNEFRFEASWGYMLDSLRLIEKTYGTPRDLMELSDKLHQRGIKLILDVVLNHVNNTLIRDPITPTNFSTKFYDSDTGWGPRPRFSSPMVKKWIMDSLIGLILDYHIDGFRFDMVKYIHVDNPSGYEFLQELNQVLKLVHPEIHLMAEELPDNVWTTFPLSQNGLGFDSQWNDLFKNFFEKDLDEYKSDHRTFDAGKLIGSLHGFSNHENFRFGQPERTVNYLGSHDFIGNRDPIIRIISDYYATERVDNETFYRVRPLSDKVDLPRKFRMIHNDFTHAFSRLAYGILFTKPGNVLFFQGEELANDLNLQNEWSYISAVNNIPTRNLDLVRYINDHKMLWEYLDPESSNELFFLTKEEMNLFKGHHQFFKDMISFRHNYLNDAQEDVYNLKTSHGGSIITYQLSNNNNDFFIILNFGYDMPAAWISFPANSSTWWREIINSSTEQYGGSNSTFTNIVDQLGERSNVVRSKGPSIIIYKKTPSPSINKQLYFMSSLNNWIASDPYKLLQKNDEVTYEVKLNIPKEGIYEFKLATHNWGIELGSANEYTYSYLNYGLLSYQPSRPNIKVLLEKGNYSFTFNIRTFGYNFIKE